MDSPLHEIEFLARSEHRTGVLDALARGPCDRDDLRTATGASSPTMGRILSDFEERRWIVRNGPTYELTPLGEFVAERFVDLRIAMETGQRLREVVPWLPREMDEFSVELFADAVVSYPGEGYPYEPVERVVQLIEGAERMRGFGAAVLKSSALEVACRAIIDGLDFEYIYPPDVPEVIYAWNPVLVEEASACENCVEFVHDSLPDGEWCGLGIYDDRVGLCCRDLETGVLKTVIDTDSPETLAWAESLYEQYRSEAQRIDEEGAIVT